METEKDKCSDSRVVTALVQLLKLCSAAVSSPGVISGPVGPFDAHSPLRTWKCILYVCVSSCAYLCVGHICKYACICNVYMPPRSPVNPDVILGFIKRYVPSVNNT